MWTIISGICIGFVLWLVAGFVWRRWKIRGVLAAIGVDTQPRREVYNQLEFIFEKIEGRTLGNSEILMLGMSVARMTDTEIEAMLSTQLSDEEKFSIYDRRLSEVKDELADIEGKP